MQLILLKSNVRYDVKIFIMEIEKEPEATDKVSKLVNKLLNKIHNSCGFISTLIYLNEKNKKVWTSLKSCNRFARTVIVTDSVNIFSWSCCT